MSQPRGRTLWHVRCVGRHLDGDATVAEFLAPAEVLTEAVRAAAAAALAECERREWSNSDVDTLRRSLGPAGSPLT